MLNIKSLSKSFGCIKVLSNITLKVGSKNILGIAGPSGGGKSTLLRCMQGLETYDAGQITFKGKSGFMFQDFQLFPHMTVMENLIYAPKLHHKSYKNLANNILSILGIEDKATSYPNTLSGGQKQRVALARSLMMQPSLLLCDEPTSGLDVATTNDVVTLLQSVCNMGITMVIASHDLDFLTKIADRIILLKNGNIAVDMMPEDFDNSIEYLKGYY